MTALVQFLDWFGIAVFAATGALVASRKQMDIFGFALLATVTGVGGGTVRDVLLGKLPVFWVHRPAYVLVCVAVSTLVFFSAHIPESRYRLLLWFDAAGFALFASIGAEKGLETGTGPVVAVFMGIVTATFGGIIRDVLGGEVPLILRKEIYVTARCWERQHSSRPCTSVCRGRSRSGSVLPLALLCARWPCGTAGRCRHTGRAPRPEMSRTGPHRSNYCARC